MCLKDYISVPKGLCFRHGGQSTHLICNHFSRKVVLQTRIFFSGWRKVVLQIRIFFSGLRKVVDQKKSGFILYKPTFFQVGEKWFCKLGFFSWFEKSG